MTSYYFLLFALVIIVATSACKSTDEGRWVLTEEEDAELEVQLKKLNKPAVKTIESIINGELFDCVDIYKQPAFDNPLLKNHKIQLRPRGFPKESLKKSSSRAKLGAEHFGYNDSCPTGTVLIRRATKEDLMASKSIPNGSPNTTYNTQAGGGDVKVHYAFLYGKNNAFVAFRANLTVWEIPSVKRNQYSASRVRITAKPKWPINAIEAGWHVFPSMYGDTRPRLFVRWTSDDYRTTGCFNLLCTGFIQTSNNFGLGSVIQEVSLPGAEKNIRVTLYLENQTGYWWLELDNVNIGYWPATLFNHLFFGEEIEFGGHVVTPASLSSPPMGNGNFPGFGSAYFRNVLFSEFDNNYYTPNNKDLNFLVDLPDYYKIWKDSAIDANFNVAFGGPGGYKST